MTAPRSLRALALALACGLLPAAARPEPPPLADAAPAATFTLELDAAGFDGEQGHAIALLFLPGSNVRRKEQATAVQVAAIHGRSARFTFPGLAPGRYAIVVFHDANDNGVIDHGLFGPIEQLGFSNGFRPGLRHGLPTFEKLEVALAPANGAAAVQISIDVR